MAKAAMLILVGTQTHADLAYLVNGMTAALEFKEAGEDVQVIFDGAATAWPGKLTDPQHPAHRLYQAVSDVVTGACAYCADAFHATEDVHGADVKLIDEYAGHPSILGLARNGYQVITF